MLIISLKPRASLLLPSTRPRQEPFRGQVVDDLSHSLLDTQVCVLQVYLWLLGCLIRRTNSGKFLDFSSSCLLIQALGISLLGNLNRNIDINLDERNTLLIIGMRTTLIMQLSGQLPVSLVRTNKTSQAYGRRIGKQLGDLRNTPYILGAIIRREAEILVEAKADVVAIEEVGLVAQFEEVLLEGYSDGGFA